MNTIIDNFEQILEFAKSYGLPPEKKRAIIREYLQTKILEIIYYEKISSKVFFVGGTSLRLLRDLNRFSEDLDFDTVDVTSALIDVLVKRIHERLKGENIEVELYKNVTKKKAYYELRFKDLLFELKISTNKDEKLKIKLDFEKFWQGQEKEVVLLKRYGFLANVITLSQSQILVQKLLAYIKREQTQPRDLYDIVWLLSRGVKLDLNFIKENRLNLNILSLAKDKFIKEKRKLKGFRVKLQPFLLNPQDAGKLELFESLIDSNLAKTVESHSTDEERK